MFGPSRVDEGACLGVIAHACRSCRAGGRVHACRALFICIQSASEEVAVSKSTDSSIAEMRVSDFGIGVFWRS